MGNFGLCFLAYGDEHIDEFNVVSNELLSTNPNLNIFVVTDNKSKINANVNIVECSEEFNFNLKRLAISEAFKQFDTIIMLDTDVKVLNKSFSFMSEIEMDGMYVKWIDNQLTHKSDRLNIHNNEYCIELNKLNNTKLQIQFIPEYCVVIKIEDPIKRVQFIDRWGEIHNKIKDFEPTDRHYDLNGAIEGCIMYLACLNLDIPVKQSNNLFNSITHYGSTKIENKLI